MDQKLNSTYLITGTNLGDRPANLRRAIVEIEKILAALAAVRLFTKQNPGALATSPVSTTRY
ncbi:2-amino-4-hydroxy-6-hydroxymethyldihydropteridine diphosphokinase [Niabella defluvii]|nr:2-amino-4-hydroxy-6-hydroxymethyldihydropteridine diphosphokinase [Niabella sp. I65]